MGTDEIPTTGDPGRIQKICSLPPDRSLSYIPKKKSAWASGEGILVFREGMAYKYFYGKARDERKMACDRRFGPGIVFVVQCFFIPRPKISEDSYPGLQ